MIFDDFKKKLDLIKKKFNFERFVKLVCFYTKK
jgi:hypothetical protein